jgi:hypothetical protein
MIKKSVSIFIVLQLIHLTIFCQKKIFTITSIKEDSVDIILNFKVFAKDSISYPLDANPNYINISNRNIATFYNIILERLTDKFTFLPYTPNEKIDYTSSFKPSFYGKIGRANSFEIKRHIFNNGNILPKGVYRVRLAIFIGTYNKGQKDYKSEFYYFEVK